MNKVFPYEEKELEKILWDSPNKINFFNEIIPIYNPYNSCPMQKFIIRLDNLVIKEKSWNGLKLAIPYDSRGTKIVNFFKSIDNKLKEFDNKKIYVYRLYEHNNFFPTIFFNFTNESKVTDSNGNSLNYNNLVRGNKISIFTILHGLISTPNKLEPKWDILQIRDESYSEQNNNLFETISFEPVSKPIQSNISYSKTQSNNTPISNINASFSSNSNINSQSSSTNRSPPKPQLNLNSDILLSAKNKLKKANSEKNNNSPKSNSPINEKYQQSKNILRKTETKESNFNSILIIENMIKTYKNISELINDIDYLINSSF
jgi:hypothetical protein